MTRHRLRPSRSPRPLAWVLALALASLPNHDTAAQPTPVKQDHPYESRYLVAGFRDADGEPVVIAADFNRTTPAPGEALLEYKAWIGRGSDWAMTLYEVHRTPLAPEQPLPNLAGGQLVVNADESVAVTLPGRADPVSIVSEAPRFVFRAEKHGIGVIRTAHVPVRIDMDGRQYRTTAVHEHVVYDHRSQRRNEEEAAEHARRLDPLSFFGRYDWVVLWDDEGRLWQVSSGTLTEDFAYRLDAGGQPSQTHDPVIRWLATRRDAEAPVDAPVRWLIDVPSWAARFDIRTVGLHAGHGPPRPDGFRPLYRQIGVKGEAVADGQPFEVFGMVESILD